MSSVEGTMKHIHRRIWLRLALTTCLFAASTVLVLVMASAPRVGDDAHGKPPVWAGITADQVLVVGGPGKAVTFTFSVVNDSGQLVNPEIDRAHLLVNNEVWRGSEMMFANGLRDDRFERLPSGDYLLFSYRIDDLFPAPGLYRVHWRAPGFESDAVTVRVLDKRPPSP